MKHYLAFVVLVFEFLFAQTFRIKAVGDLVFGTNYPVDRLPKNPRKTLFRHVEEYLKGAHLLMGNYEGTLTDHPRSAKNISRPNMFAFRAPPEYAKVLADVGFHLMNVANNHSGDFFYEGYVDTQKALRQYGISVTGMLDHIEYMQLGGKKVAAIGFSYLRHNSIHDLKKGAELVKKARKGGAEIVVVTFHGGAEGSAYIHTRNQIEMYVGENRGNVVAFSRAMIDAGADIVIGHGPHVPRALELYKGKLIAYSLGNFMGYYVFGTKGYTNHSLILEAELNEKGDFMRGRVIPLELSKANIPAYDPEKKTIKLLQKLIREDFPETKLVLDDEGNLKIKE
ncbi:MAG: CapA family protein [Leptospiraceae bacterium]|nr:CapA family protein [Leptospiraceae bacterium]MDW8306515.1 CapA family protein [Leptospiraceae bacterium]